MDFWLKKISLKDVFINSIWSLIAWLIASIFILFIMFIVNTYFNIINNYEQVALGLSKINGIFPIITPFIIFIWLAIAVFLTNFILTLTSPETYKKSIVINGQLAFFLILLFVFISPIYIIKWVNYDNIIYIFISHILIAIFASSIIIELLNNYRNILLGLYGSFIWLFFSMLLLILFFSFLPGWLVRLIVLFFLLPIINMFMTFFKQLFNYLYYNYNRYYNLDPLWDIFYKIELEEEEKLRYEEINNNKI